MTNSEHGTVITADDKWYADCEAFMATQIDSAFLEKLTIIARCYGWDGDYIEIEGFVRGCYASAEKEPPDLAPFSYEPDKAPWLPRERNHAS